MGMEPFVAADDNAFGHLVASIPNPIANLQQAIAFRLGAQQKQAETAQANAETQVAGAQVAALQNKLQRQQQFQQDLGAVGNDPTPQAISSLIIKYPEFADQIKQGWDVKDAATKQADLTQSGEIYSAAASGNWDLALKQAQARLSADQEAGKADPEDQAFVDAITQAQQGDPKAQKQVLTMLGTHIAAVSGPEHFATVYGALKGGYTLDEGAARYDENGQMVAHSPFIKDADGNIRLWTDTTNPPPADSSPATPAAGGFDNAVATVLGNEGGYNPSDLNGSPTNFGINQKANAATLQKMGLNGVKQLTRDQAIQIYRGYWDESGAANLPANMQTPYFDVYVRSPRTAKAALAESQGDPVTFMHLTDAYFQHLAQNDPNAKKYANAWANRDARNLAIATGEAPAETAAPARAAADAQTSRFPIVIPGASSDQYRVLSDAEVKQRGLDPGQQYQLNTKTGQVTGLGQKTGESNDVLNRYGIAPNETGSSVLAKLPANMANQVKALAEGRLPMPSSFALAKPYWQQMLQLTSQYDPSFDASSYPARKAAITAFTGMGKGAQVVGSVNRVANHLNTLWNENKKLAGPETGFSVTNSLAASIGQAFEPADAKAYDTAVGFVAGELEKIARNSPGTEAGVDRVVQNLGRKNSEKTREAAIKTAVDIIAGAIDPLKDQYNSAFTNDSARPKIPWVTPQAQKIYENIGGTNGGVDLSLTGSNADTNSSNDSLPSGARVIGTYHGKRVIEVNGKRMVEQ